MNEMTKFPICVWMSGVVAALFLAGPLRAQTTEAMGGLRIERNPALLGMAGAGTSSTSVNMAYAALGNPAASAQVHKTIEAGVSYATWAPQYAAGKTLSVGVTGRPAEDLSLSVALSRQGFGTLDSDTEAGFAPSDLLFGAGVGYALGESFSLGASLVYMKQALLSDYSLSALAVNALAQYRFAGLNVAAGLVNLGGKVKSDGGSSYALPTSVKLAADYTLSFGKADLQFALDGDYFFSGNYAVAAGLNLGIGGIGFLRGGYRFASAQAVIPSFLALGGGLTFKGVTLDLAYLTASDVLSGTWMAGIGYRF